MRGHPQNSWAVGPPEHLHNLPHTLRPIPWTGGQPPPPLPRGTAAPLVLLLHGGAQVAAETENQLLANLSLQERQRHATYQRSAAQARFLLARASLRQLLGHWLQQPAATIPIEADLLGKPRCPTAGAPAFNLSHSGDLILLAFHATAEVGVDVEQARPNLQWERIARRWLTPAEVAELRALPQAEQGRGFLAAWCRLEARVKASGQGLGGIAGSGAAAVHLWDVRVPMGYAAAAALRALTAPGESVARAGHPSPLA